MNKKLFEYVATKTGAEAVVCGDVIQSLWSGYGEILRVHLEGEDRVVSDETVVLKYVSPPDQVHHPRGWNTDRSHQRKLQSYQVEKNWYQSWASLCDESCRVPKCYAADSLGEEVVIIMEDLDAAGFPMRKDWLNQQEIHLCLQWLANFHATFLRSDPQGLWPEGTYWHLATRPDEFQKINDKPIQDLAVRLDSMLNNCRYKTVVHGDAKVANFCFSAGFDHVAAVDFQYVGGGCGMKDVAYFIGSCMDEEACANNENELLDYYFLALKKAIEQRGVCVDFAELEREWRELFPVAWTDFYRFLLGWMPSHWKVNDYSLQLANNVIAQYGDMASR